MQPLDPDGGETTRASAERMLTALFDLYADCEQQPELMVKYALCDSLPGSRCLQRWEGRHLCDQQGLAFSTCDRAGQGLYLEELEGNSS